MQVQHYQIIKIDGIVGLNKHVRIEMGSNKIIAFLFDDFFLHLIFSKKRPPLGSGAILADFNHTFFFIFAERRRFVFEPAFD